MGKNNNFDDISQDKIEIVKQTQAESQRVLVGRLKPKRNHILFEFDLNNKQVRRAEFRNTFIFGQSNKTGKEVDVKEGCIYISALNEENGWKKFYKFFSQAKKEE